MSNSNLMNECEHWKRMNINLSQVVDELNSPMMNKITGILKDHKPSLLDFFETKRATLHNDYISVKEISNLLETLQYFFKVIVYYLYDIHTIH